MNFKEYQAYEVKRQDIISKNRSNRIKGLPQVAVPERVERPKRRCAYSQDGDYLGFLRDGEEVPEGAVMKLEYCNW